ncbi:hypothetical protein [Pandoraea anhela]|uniref:Uncharacterized protein n=1 Tax=Pandoraea anhela TaxID=2508295 RepID=A0A5E4RVH3_9BURK|nr:hypothetical protein [Pandoraea anhela]VVD67043.1 hypothetical protein PAN31108_00414 [Pandoraea anhela]
MQIASQSGSLALAWQSSHAATSSETPSRGGQSGAAPGNSTYVAETGGDTQIEDVPQAARVSADLLAALAALDWRARVVHALVCTQDGAWGQVSSALAFHLLDRRDTTWHPAIQCGVRLLTGWLADSRGMSTGAPPAEVLYDGQRFGICRQGGVEWAAASMACHGLWHALLAGVEARRMSEVDLGDRSMWRALMSRLVLSDPACAVAAWQTQLAGNAPEFRVPVPGTLRDLLRTCGRLLATGAALGVSSGFASGALFPAGSIVRTDGAARASGGSFGSFGSAGSAQPGQGMLATHMPLAVAAAAGVLELAAAVRTYAALPDAESSNAFQRAQYLSVLSFLLPSLRACELRQLVLRLGPQFARLDLYDVASAVQRRLERVDARAPHRTPQQIIDRLNVGRLYRKARERERQAFRFDPPGAAQALEAALQMACAMDMLAPGANRIRQGRELRRSERWARWCAEQDAVAQARAPLGLTARVDEPSAQRKASPIARTFVMKTDDLPLPDMHTRANRTMLRDIVEHRLLVGFEAASAMSWRAEDFMAHGAATPDASDAAGAGAPPGHAHRLANAAFLPAASTALGAMLGVRSRTGWLSGLFTGVASLILPGASARKNRPMHHAKPLHVTDAPAPTPPMRLVPGVESSALDQMLHMIEATEISRAQNVSIDGYAGRAQAHLCLQMEAVLNGMQGGAVSSTTPRTNGADAAPVKPTMPWGGEVEVTFQFWGRSPDPSRFTMGWGSRMSQNFTIFDIALGHHFLREFRTPSGISEIVSVAPVDADHATLLARVNNDNFRKALRGCLADELKRQQNNPLLIDAYEAYVRNVFTGVLVNATSDAWERQSPPGGRVGGAHRPWHPSRAGSGQRRRFRVGYGAVRLLAYDGQIVPDLVCVSQPSGGAVVLISIAHAMAFHWSPTAESTEAFQRFMHCHLSKMQRQHLERYARWSPLRFRIDTGVLTNRPCRASRADSGREPIAQRPLNATAESYSQVSLKPAFSFVSCPSPERELWFAKVARADADRDLLIVTDEMRDMFRSSTMRQKVLDALKFSGPATAMAFNGTGQAGAIMTLACELDPHGAAYATLADRAQRADLDELRRIQREMSVAASVSSLFRNPHLRPIDAVADWTLENLDNMREISRSIDTFMTSWPEVSRRRQKFADEVASLHSGAKAGATPVTQPIWVALSAIKSRQGLRTGGVATQPLSVQDKQVDRFLGSAAAQVISNDRLSRIPQGYCVALMSADGTTGFAGVTSGERTILGALVNDTGAPVPYAIDCIDIAQFTFLADGLCRYGDREGKLYVEPLTDRLPVWSDSAKRIAARANSSHALRATSMGTSTTPLPASRDGAMPAGAGWFKPQPNAEHLASHIRGKRAADRWTTFVDAWYAQEGRVSAGAALDVMRRNATTAQSTTTAPPPRVEAVIGREGRGAQMPSTPPTPTLPAHAIAAHWNTAPVKHALTQFIARVQRGLLLWHLPQMSPTHAALVLNALRKTAPFRLVTVDAVRLPGVVGLGDGPCRVLFSLTSGEAVALGVGSAVAEGAPELPPAASAASGTSDASAAALRAFLAPHRHGTGQAMRVALGPSLSDDGIDPIIDDLLDHVSATRQRNQTLDAGIVDLVGHVARTLSPQDARALRATLGDAAPDAVELREEVVYLNEAVGHSQTSPGLGWAYDIGTAIREFSDDIFLRSSVGERVDEATAFASAFVDRIRQCRVQHRVSRDIASLIEFGIGRPDFARAMLGAGVGLDDGKFGAAMSALRAQVPGRPGLCTRQPAALQLIPLRSAEALAGVPRGHRILSRPASAESRQAATHDALTYDDMLSLGNGHIAEARAFGTTGHAGFRLACVDVTRDDASFRWSDERGAWHCHGVDVDLWMQSDTPGIYAEPAAPRLQAGTVSAAQCESALRSLPAVSALQPERTGSRELTVDARLALMVEAVATTLRDYGVADIRYRMIAAWSSPDQYRPKLSLAVTGKALASWVEAGNVDRVIADGFPRQTLGDASGISSDARVISEVDWQAQYADHGANRCIKYIDFASLNDALDAAWEITTMPGALAGDFRPQGVMLRLPEWRTATGTPALT